MINEIMKRLSELPKVTMDDGQEYIQLYDAMETVKMVLEQEPCEDAISRDAVLEKAVYTETEEGWCGYTVDVDYIKSLPSIKPQEISDHNLKMWHDIYEKEGDKDVPH